MEKAAIIHPDTRAVVIGEQSPDAMEVINDRISGLNSDRKCSLVVKRADSLSPLVTQINLGLLGVHQQENAEVAILLAEILQDHFTISTGHIARGLEQARHPGRLEYQEHYLFDGAHNIGGAKVLAEYIREFETRPITLVFGVMREKNVVEMLSILAPLAGSIVLTRPENPRSVSCEELRDQLPSNFSVDSIFMSNGVLNAIEIANEVTPDEGIILVTGSLYLVGETKSLLKGK
jgi:dihydrofolate synthase/folylpolyglutamate synthase